MICETCKFRDGIKCKVLKQATKWEVERTDECYFYKKNTAYNADNIIIPDSFRRKSSSIL